MLKNNKFLYIIWIIALSASFSFYQCSKGDSSSKKSNNQKNISADSIKVNWADSVLIAMKGAQGVRNPTNDLPLLNTMLDIYTSVNDVCNTARVNGLRCQCYDMLGQIDSAIMAGQLAIMVPIPPCDSLLLMSNTVYYTNPLLSSGDFEKVLSVTDSALAHWNYNWPVVTSHNGLLTNRAIAKASMGDLIGAFYAFRDAMITARLEKIPQNEIDACSNMGAILGMLAENEEGKSNRNNFIDSSIFYNNLALKLNKNSTLKADLSTSYSNISFNYFYKGDYSNALVYLDSCQMSAIEFGNLNAMVTSESIKSDCFRGLGKLDSAIAHLYIYNYLKDSLMNGNKIKAIADMQEKYGAEKKSQQIILLGKDKEVQNKEIQRQKLLRNSFIAGFIMLAIFVIIVIKQRNKVKKEKARSEELLLNILPAEVAEELKEKGSAEAKLIDEVTVLFTDFKGFTQLSEKLSPKELVGEINECFSAFDQIMQKHGVEKIKTIGDAYMAAGGLPTSNTTHANDVVKAALDIQKFMNEHKALKEAAGELFFEIRIGVHSGPVVAGIVGIKKFAYDIWGDTVNTASRMESSGDVGQVNISGTTYELVKDKFACTHRGKIQAKGKGELDMYFVEREK